MSRFAVGVRVRCIRPEGQEAWAVDGMVGQIVAHHVFPLLKPGDEGIPMGKGWEGYSVVGMSTTPAWDVAIAGFGVGHMPEERLEPLDGEAAQAVSVQRRPVEARLALNAVGAQP